MQEEGSAFGGGRASLEVRYTDKPVSGWGGLVAVVRYMDQSGCGNSCGVGWPMDGHRPIRFR